MKKATRRRLAFLVGFVLYFGSIWYFWDSALVYPLKIFVVLLHEVSHAAALAATGGSVESITLDVRQGGATYGQGGSPLVTLSAGYLGSLLWGVLLVVAGHGRRIPGSLVLALVGGAVAGLAIVFVRSTFGLGFGLAFGATLILLARWLPELWSRRILLVLGLTSCLYAILDIKSDVLDRPYLESDAAVLARLTGVPTVVWGVLWIVVALGVSARLFHWAYRRA